METKLIFKRAKIGSNATLHNGRICTFATSSSQDYNLLVAELELEPKKWPRFKDLKINIWVVNVYQVVNFGILLEKFDPKGFDQLQALQTKV